MEQEGVSVDVLTKHGQCIMCLPDKARCRLSGKTPHDMDKCPICNFDDYGDICVPELCDEYEEGEPTPNEDTAL